jgi:hypothetical protein
LLTVVFDMVIAVSVGIVLAALLFMRRMAEVAQVRIIGEGHLEAPANLKLPPGVMIYDISGPLFFGAAQKAMGALGLFEKARAVILELDQVPAMDATGLVALESAVAAQDGPAGRRALRRPRRGAGGRGGGRPGRHAAARAGRGADGRALARVVAGDLADQRAGRGAAHGSLRARALAGLGGGLLIGRGLLLLLLDLFAELERVRAGVLDRPGVAGGLVLRLLLGRLSRGRERVDVHRGREALPARGLDSLSPH